MKNLIISTVLAFFAAACGQNANNNKDQREVEIQKTATYSIDTAASNVSWQRDVENKIENKQIQIFGATATVNIENAAYTSNGTLPVLGGKLVFTNDTLTGMELRVNFTMVRLFSKSGTKTISTEEFPPSLMKIDKIKADTVDGQYVMEGKLTIKDKTNPVRLTANVKKSEKDRIHVNGVLTLQTLEWPIREDANPENVRKDDIILTMQLIYTNPVNKSDTLVLKTR